MKPIHLITVLLVCIFLFNGCTMGAPTATATVVEPTSTTAPLTPTPEPPTATPEPTPTNTPIPVPIDATIGTTSLNLRSGPGTTFSVLGMYASGGQVSILGKAPGNEWVQVKTSDNQTGWMSVQFLKFTGDLGTSPVLEIKDSLTITGNVIDTSNKGVQGVNLALILTTNGNQKRTDAISNAQGTFYAYLPSDSQGSVTVGVVGVVCTSPIVDASCNYAGTFEPGGNVVVEIPQSKPLVFVYKQ